MGVKVNIDNVISDYQKSGGKTKFPKSLRKVLEFASKDKNLKSVNHLAYLLATAKAESDYSLERWESDYLCGSTGVKYQDKPCQRAINYYCSSEGGKANYCSRELDKRGLPYFGRGLIQITWKDNYKKYGDRIGVNLADNPEAVFKPENSYRVASAYLVEKRGSSKKSTFDWVDEGNLTQARKSVNGGTRGLDEVNGAYSFWKGILKNNNAKVVEGTGITSKNNKKIWLGVGLIALTLAVTGTIIYIQLKKKK